MEYGEKDIAKIVDYFECYLRGGGVALESNEEKLGREMLFSQLTKRLMAAEL